MQATEKQKNYMKKLGLAFKDDITAAEASKLIDSKVGKKENHNPGTTVSGSGGGRPASISNKADFQPASKVMEKPNLQQMMGDALFQAQEIYDSALLSEEFRQKLEWSKVALSLFIQKCRESE